MTPLNASRGSHPRMPSAFVIRKLPPRLQGESLQGTPKQTIWCGTIWPLDPNRKTIWTRDHMAIGPQDRHSLNVPVSSKDPGALPSLSQRCLDPLSLWRLWPLDQHRTLSNSCTAGLSKRSLRDPVHHVTKGPVALMLQSRRCLDPSTLYRLRPLDQP